MFACLAGHELISESKYTESDENTVISCQKTTFEIWPIGLEEALVIVRGDATGNVNPACDDRDQRSNQRRHK